MINLDDRIFEQVKDESQMWLLLHIAKRINKDMSCFPTNYTLAKDCGWGKNKVQKVKKELKKMGLIEVEARTIEGKQRANNYIVNTEFVGIYVPLKKIKATLFEGTLNEGTLNEGTLKQGNRSINNKEVLTITSINNNNNGKKLLPKFSFDSFWNKYNYKKNKQQALKAWKKLKDEDKEKALKAVDGYLTYLQAKNHPQCHASTWLNNRRFEDDNSTEQKQGEIKITQEQAKKELINLYRAYKDTEIWKKKYSNQAQSDYIKALNLFYLENPKLKDNGPTTS